MLSKVMKDLLYTVVNSAFYLNPSGFTFAMAKSIAETGLMLGHISRNGCEVISLSISQCHRPSNDQLPYK